MKLKFFKALISSHEEDDLPVCIADWSNEYDEPSEAEAVNVEVKNDWYRNERGEVVKGKFLCIGSYRDWK